MDEEELPFMRASSVYFMNEHDQEDISPAYRVNLNSDHWESTQGPEWTTHGITGTQLPIQGWKVHVSATIENSHSILEKVASVCLDMKVPFKHLSTRARLFIRNSDLTAREHACKFITCYPTESSLKDFLDSLELSLKGFEGPYILSDRRWSKAPIYLRYGVFVSDPELNSGGRDLVRPDGTVELDRRDVSFAVPSWLGLPDFLQEWIRDSVQDASDGELPLSIISAVKFNTSGGVYKGSIGGVNTILKEGRPFAGNDPEGRDGYTRVKHEAIALKQFGDIFETPKVIWEGQVWEHYFIALEEMPGEPLNRWVTSNAPVYAANAASTAEYFAKASSILRSLIDTVNRIHSRGWTHQDIHLSNILVDDRTDELKVSLIDFEGARENTNVLVRQKFAGLGFRSSGLRRPSDIDWFGVLQIGCFLLLPTVRMTELLPDYAQQVTHTARQVIHLRLPELNAEASEYLEELIMLVTSLNDRVPTSTENRVDPHEVELRSAKLETFTSHNEMDFLQFEAKTVQGLLSTSGSVKHRTYPVHFYGLSKPNIGFAFGDQAIFDVTLKTLPSKSRKKADEIAIKPTTHAASMDSLGLMDGIAGDVLAQVSMGMLTCARRHLSDSFAAMLELQGRRVWEGLPGVLLALTRASLIEPSLLRPEEKDSLRKASHQLAKDYLLNPEVYGPTKEGKDELSNIPYRQDSGLLYGHLGIAWSLLSCSEALGGDDLWKEAIDAALLNEIDGYVYDQRYDTLQHLQGRRQLPYLATGSAGFGIILSHLSKAEVPTEVTDAAPLLLNAVRPSYCVFPGLFNGAAGLMLGELGLTQFLGEDPPKEADCIKFLSPHVIQSNQGFLFAGDSGTRITTDIASGSAGIIIALRGIRNAQADFLPFPGGSYSQEITTSTIDTLRG